jgi:hypothetical protein
MYLCYNRCMTIQLVRRKRNRKSPFASLKDAFLSHLIPGLPTECWVWPDCKSKAGYGQFTYQSTRYYAHRAAYEIFCGSIPSGLDILHTCDNPPCCNPAHLWAGTALDNINDMISKGRARRTPARGETSVLAKITAEDVIAIRRMDAEGITHEVIATHFPIARCTVSAICRRSLWKHIP